MAITPVGCAQVPAAAQGQLEGAVGRRLGADDLDADEDLCAEAQRLLVGSAGQVRAADALRKARVVLDPRAGTGLAARGYAFQNDRAQPLGRGVDRSGEPGGPAPTMTTSYSSRSGCVRSPARRASSLRQ